MRQWSWEEDAHPPQAGCRGEARTHGVAREMVGGLSAVHGRVARADRPCGARLAPRAHGRSRLTIVGRAPMLIGLSERSGESPISMGWGEGRRIC